MLRASTVSTEEIPMAKGILALAAILAATHTVEANAADGCTILEDLVKRSVHASATEYYPRQPARRVHSFARGGSVGSTVTGKQACPNTAEVTTRAFSRALAGLNMPISWNRRGPMNPGDYCLSGDLSQCYPSQYPLYPSMGPHQMAFVYDAWKGVRRAVAAQMPFGTAAGLAQFNPDSLEVALSSSLQTSVDGPLYSSYQGFVPDKPVR
jgi:hypothetical protein